MLLLGIPQQRLVKLASRGAQQRLAAGFPASLHILNSIYGVSENALEGLSARLVLSFSKKWAFSWRFCGVGVACLLRALSSSGG